MALTQIIVNTKYFNNNFSTLLSHRKRTFEKFSKRSAQLSVVELRRNIVLGSGSSLPVVWQDPQPLLE